MGFKGKFSVNLDLPVLEAQEQLEIIAERIIKTDIAQRMNKGIDISDGKHPKNKKSTLDFKKKRNLKYKVPLVASGQLRKSFRVLLKGDDSVIISPRGTRRNYPKPKGAKRRKRGVGQRSQPTNHELADILQNKGLKDGTKYEFFGISDKAEIKAMKFLNNYIRKAIKRGGRRTIR